MTRINRMLAALAIAVLVGALSLLGWLGRVASNDMTNAIVLAQRSLAPDVWLHGPGGTRLVDFAAAERAVALAREGHYFRDVMVTKLDGEREIPVVPYTWAAQKGTDWQKQLAGWRRVPLSAPGSPPVGYLYLQENDAVQRTIHWAMGATALAIALILGALLARLWSQETSLTRTRVELGDRKQELIRVERLALAGQLAAGLLHDLRKPVLNIQHSIEELAEALGDFAPATPALADQRRQTRLFFQILNDSQMERFVQSDRAGAEFVDLGPLLDFATGLVRYERRAVEVLRRDPDDLPPLFGQPFKLVQLFSNLILNAYQAMGGQGRLTIDAAPLVGPPKLQSGRERSARGGEGSNAAMRPEAGPGIEIRLSDTGPGIESENLIRIFDPFFTTKGETVGSGLGLSISKMIVEEMGGVISVRNNVEAGANFTIWLPVETDQDRKAGS